MLPNFLIIGASRSGTTSLYSVLRRHPDIFMSPRKEVHFFEKDSNYRRGLSLYARHFARARGQRAVGEATPAYLCHPNAPARIAEHLPGARLVAILRNPVTRAYSQYWYRRRLLDEPLSFERAVTAYRGEVYRPGERGYFSRGFYLTYLDRYLKFFPREQVHVLLFEDMVADPPAFYRDLFRFLDVEETFSCAEMGARHNQTRIWKNPAYRFFFKHPRLTAYLPRRTRRALCVGPRQPYRYPPMPDAIRQELVAYFRDANGRLAEFLGRDLSSWNR
jgi:hypothetical protein